MLLDIFLSFKWNVICSFVYDTSSWHTVPASCSNEKSPLLELLALNLTKFKFTFKFFNFFLTFFVTTYLMCMYIKHLTETRFLLHQSEENFVRLFFILVLQFEKLMETGSLCIWDLWITVSLICCFGQYIYLQAQYAHGLDL